MGARPKGLGSTGEEESTAWGRRCTRGGHVVMDVELGWCVRKHGLPGTASHRLGDARKGPPWSPSTSATLAMAAAVRGSSSDRERAKTPVREFSPVSSARRLRSH